MSKYMKAMDTVQQGNGWGGGHDVLKRTYIPPGIPTQSETKWIHQTIKHRFPHYSDQILHLKVLGSGPLKGSRTHFPAAYIHQWQPHLPSHWNYLLSSGQSSSASHSRGNASPDGEHAAGMGSLGPTSEIQSYSSNRYWRADFVWDTSDNFQQSRAEL